MAHEHDGAVKAGEGVGERLARGQVKVVGRLVEQQQGGALPHEHGEHEARFFAAAHLPRRLQRHVAGKVETAEEAAQRRFAGGVSVFQPKAARELLHVLQGAGGGVQRVQRVLREVADGEVFALAHAARQQRQGAGDGFDEGGFALPVGAKNADALAGAHLPRDAAQHGARLAAGALRVAEGGVADGEHGVGQGVGRAPVKVQLFLGKRGGNVAHFFQRLEPALRLPRLGGFGAETLDKTLQPLAALLLALALGLLLGDLGGAQRLKGAVAARVAAQAAAAHVQRDLAGGVEEVAVVADDDERAGKARQPAF